MAYKTFTNGSVLPASDLNTYLMNQSVMTFVSAAARDAVLTAPTEGMITYLEDDNKLYLYTGAVWELQNPITTEGDLIIGGTGGIPERFAKGDNDEILQIIDDEIQWAPFSGGGQALLSTTTLTGSSVSITSIPSSYKSLRLVIRNYTPDTDGSSLRMTFNNSVAAHIEATGAAGTSPQAFETSGSICRPTDNAVSASAIVVNLHDYANTTGWKVGDILSAVPDSTDPTEVGHRTLLLATNITSAISSIQLFPDSGDFSSGTALLYGVN